jgi:hypothetical protein
MGDLPAVNGPYLDPALPDVGFFQQALSEDELNQFIVHSRHDTIRGEIKRHHYVEIPILIEQKLLGLMEMAWQNDLQLGEEFVIDSTQLLISRPGNEGQDWHLDSIERGYVMMIAMTGLFFLFFFVFFILT